MASSDPDLDQMAVDAIRNVLVGDVSLWRQRVAVALTDGSSWVIALPLATWIRHEFDLTPLDTGGLARMTLVALPALWMLGMATHTYRGRYPIGSLEDALNLARVMGMVGLVVLSVVLVGFAPSVARSVPLMAAMLALTMSVAPRLLVRLYQERLARPDHESAHRVIIYGAGVRGQGLARSMLADGASGYLPAAFLDDDPRMRRRRIAGVDVRGTRFDLPEVATATQAQLLVIASQSVTRPTMQQITGMARQLGLDVKVLPALSELFRPWASASDLRELDVSDLLCRRPVNTDIASIAGCLSGKRVLVTGAGGSIGSELCRQIHKFGPAELFMLDRDESALHAVQLSIHGSTQLSSPTLVLADIRDAAAVQAVFATRRPDVVFHAAALKHLPMLEQYPEEAWKTNVLGTLHVLDAAMRVDVQKFVNISSDKAANPVSVLGRSKRIGERLVAGAARTDRAFLSVRFGNVLGSRGSVLTTFAEQLATGGPLTVTHPEVTRFFMLVSEAVQLVVQAAAIGRPGEVLVLDMGAPVRITELARLLMMASGRQARIVFTGLHDGEKLHEDLFGDGELDHRPIHPAISHIAVPGIDPISVRARGALLGGAAAMLDLLDEPVMPTPCDDGMTWQTAADRPAGHAPRVPTQATGPSEAGSQTALSPPLQPVGAAPSGDTSGADTGHGREPR
jgi:FlaA1/EpsC-like NDP-sugar epimerase